MRIIRPPWHGVQEGSGLCLGNISSWLTAARAHSRQCHGRRSAASVRRARTARPRHNHGQTAMLSSSSIARPRPLPPLIGYRCRPWRFRIAQQSDLQSRWRGSGRQPFSALSAPDRWDGILSSRHSAARRRSDRPPVGQQAGLARIGEKMSPLLAKSGRWSLEASANALQKRSIAPSRNEHMCSSCVAGEGAASLWNFSPLARIIFRATETSRKGDLQQPARIRHPNASRATEGLPDRRVSSPQNWTFCPNVCARQSQSAESYEDLASIRGAQRTCYLSREFQSLNP